jgi:hypothetical protein
MSLVPQLFKDVTTFIVFFEEDAIMRDEHFELIYSQSGLLYNIFPDAPRLILDKTRQRARPHADGIVGSTQTKPAEQLTKQLQQLSIQHTAASQTTSLAAPPTQMSEVHTVQSTNPKATSSLKVLGPHIVPFCPYFLPLLYPGSPVFRLILSFHLIIPRYTTSFLITTRLICFA